MRCFTNTEITRIAPVTSDTQKLHIFEVAKHITQTMLPPNVTHTVRACPALRLVCARTFPLSVADTLLSRLQLGTAVLSMSKPPHLAGFRFSHPNFDGAIVIHLRLQRLYFCGARTHQDPPWGSSPHSASKKTPIPSTKQLTLPRGKEARTRYRGQCEGAALLQHACPPHCLAVCKDVGG